MFNQNQKVFGACLEPRVDTTVVDPDGGATGNPPKFSNRQCIVHTYFVAPIWKS